MPKREIQPATGLYKNGSRFWVRTVRGPLTGTIKPLSTGTTDAGRANAALAMVHTFSENPKQYQWLELALSGDVSLDQLLTHHAAGSLHQLQSQLEAKQAADADGDLRPWVTQWDTDHLATLDLDDITKGNYLRQVRFFIPETAPFPKSKFTEDYIKAQLATLTGARHDKSAKASGSTKRRYLVALQQFIRYARKRVPLESDPLADVDWVPKNGSPRMTTHTHEQRLAVLDRMAGQDRVAMALVYGSGIELGALLALKGAHIGETQPDGRGLITAPGTKNEYREERTIYVDAWAWKIVKPHTDTILPRGSVFSYNPKNDGKELRDAFYCAQVAAGLIEQPAKNEKTRKLLWGRVKPHTIHDARHTYAEIRALGLDGEPAQDITFIAQQFGHADETMVMRIYKKKNLKERQRALQVQQTQKAAQAAGGK